MESFVSSDGKKCCNDSQLRVQLKTLSDKLIQKYDKDFYEKYVLKETNKESEEITQTESMRCLGLIPTKELESKPLESLKKDFPLRRIARIGDQLKDDSNRLLLNKTLIVRQNIKKVVQRLRTKTDINVKKSKLLSKEDIKKQKQFEEKKELMKQLRHKSNEKKKIISFVSQFEISSQLFDRLIRIFGHLLSPSEVAKASQIPSLIPNYDKNNKLLKCGDVFKYNNWDTTNIQRRALKSELAFGVIGRPRKYTFTRRQRLEKYNRLKYGLNWKSRLLRFDCRQFVINLMITEECAVCSQPLVENHSCGGFSVTEKHRLVDNGLGEDIHKQGIETNGETSLDLSHLINESIVMANIDDKDLENDWTKKKEMTQNKETAKNNMKRALFEIGFNFEVNSSPKSEAKRRSKRLKSTQK